VNLPAELQQAIEGQVSRFNPSDLKPFCDELSTAYRQGVAGHHSPLRSDAYRCAYLATRMPATYGAVSSVLSRVGQSLSTLGVESVLDLGAGPGTASWAAASQLPGVAKMTLFERDASLVSVGKAMAQVSSSTALLEATWMAADLSSEIALPPHDLVLCSYVLSELSENSRAAVVEKAWASATKSLLIIEPGTPVGFGVLRQIRDRLLAKGASLLAPCPHALVCPMTGSDWCHFSVRLERSKLHRYLKSGTQGYEDEKYSYLVFVKSPFPRPAYSRILRHPQYAPGSVDLTLCTDIGVTAHVAIGKNQRDAFKRARKVEWGDAWFVDRPKPAKEIDLK